MAAKYTANPGILSASIDAVDLAAAIGAGTEFALSIPSQGTPTVSWMTAFAGGNPASITVLLQASLDGTNWFTVDTSTSTTGELRTVQGSFRFIRVNNSAVAGGGGVTLTSSFVYSNSYSTNQPIPLIQAPAVIIPQAAMQTSFTTEIELVPAPGAGFMIRPVEAILSKAAGAYTTAGVTSGLLCHGTVADALNWMPFFGTSSSDTAATVLGGAGVTKAMPVAVGNGTSAVFAGLEISARINKKLAYKTNGANPAGAGGDVTIRVWYRLLQP